MPARYQEVVLEHAAPESTCKSERYMTAEDDGESRSQGELVAPISAENGEADVQSDHPEPSCGEAIAEDWVEIKESEEAEMLTPAPSPMMPILPTVHGVTAACRVEALGSSEGGTQAASIASRALASTTGT